MARALPGSPQAATSDRRKVSTRRRKFSKSVKAGTLRFEFIPAGDTKAFSPACVKLPVSWEPWTGAGC